MDLNLSYTISNEDLTGVLRTILMFLESVNFSATSSVFQQECLSKGFSDVLSARAKTVVVTPTVVELQPTTSICKRENCCGNHSTRLVISENVCSNETTPYSCTVQNPSGTDDSKQSTTKLKTKSQNSSYKRSPNSIETETPTSTSSKEVRREQKKNLRKSMSNPTLRVSNTKITSLELAQNGDTAESKELKKKFEKLQAEHQKLMGVATELTAALQTQIMGQSENLNSMLNNCRNIYPDLFKYNFPLGQETSAEIVKDDVSSNTQTPPLATENNEEREESQHESANQPNSVDASLKITDEIKLDRTVKFSENAVGGNGKDESMINEVDKTLTEVIHTVLSPALKRPHSSSVILVTTSKNEANEGQEKQRILVRQISSVSCDDSLITIMSKAEKSSQEVVFRDETTAENAKGETVEFSNYYEPPEIYVTSENVGQTKRSSSSSLASPRNGYFDLDFKKLKKDMLNGDDELKVKLAQALRWRITRSDEETRDQIVSSYIRHDLLGLHSSSNPSGQSVLEGYFCPNKATPHALQESMARLVNTFASVTLGRDYLCQDDDLLVSLLVPIVIGTHYSKTNIDDSTRNMLIAILQKLSLRNKQRIKIISAGLVEHLLSFLTMKQNEMSEYCMEYSTALLMNLCLHREARERLHPSVTDVVSLLADLMGTKHKCCMPYVNGAMYSLLSDPFINQEAKRLNLAKLIEYHIKRTDGEMKTQLQYILKLHLEGTEDGECVCDACNEPQNEVDLLEPELDANDPVKGEPAGEDLLQEYKLLFPAYGSQVQSVRLKCLCRPITAVPRTPNANHRGRTTKTSTEIEKDVKNTGENCCEKSNNEQRKNVKQNFASTSKLENTNQEKVSCISQQSSRSESPDMAYSEDTKQFYHIPSAKNGIFENHKGKRAHKVPPSFTRTIPLRIKTEPPPSACTNPHCPAPYVKTMPFVPTDNSSARNPPYALHFPSNYGICYRETSTNANGNCSCSNCKPNKYRCGCYNVIKGFVDQDRLQNNTGKNKKNNKKAKVCRCNKPINQQLYCNCQKSQFSALNFSQYNPNSPSVNQIVDANSNTINFTYEELLANTNSDSRTNHVCSNSNVECKCYDEVFQSRPKILRTPP